MSAFGLAVLLVLGAFAGCASREPGAERRQANRRAGGLPTPRPLIRLALVTDLNGVLEPCGCTPSSAGGADKIAAKLAELRAEDPSLLFLLSGDMLFGPATESSPVWARVAVAQATLKAGAWVELLRWLKPSAVVPGPRDFELGSAELRSLAQQKELVLLGERGAIHGVDGLSVQAVREVRSQRIGLSVGLGPVPESDVLIRFKHGEQFATDAAPGADVVVYAGLSAPRSLAVAQDGVLHVSAGHDGEEITVLELWPEGSRHQGWQLVEDPPTASQANVARILRHRLTAVAPSEPRVRRLMEQLFARIRDESSTLSVPADRQEERGKSGFVGARTCAACHTQAYFAWLKTPHALAYETLVRRGRQLDLECIACHVTGFEQPGGARLGHLGELAGVGCESCHGAGEAHSDDPRAEEGSVRREVATRQCLACHDPKHSDYFDNEARRQRVVSRGHGLRE